VGRLLGTCAIAFPVALTVGAPGAHAEVAGGFPNRPVGDHQGLDTHITGIGIVQTVDCNNSTLHVNGTGNQITALGACWGVTLQGSSNVVVADNVINDVTVYGWDQSVLYKNGEPFVWDRGRELGMTNRIDRVPA
jgi:Protein of unknown function (DUF3060)